MQRKIIERVEFMSGDVSLLVSSVCSGAAASFPYGNTTVSVWNQVQSLGVAQQDC